MDYHILSNPHYDYVDLQQAKARGLSDSQIATIAKIAEKSGTPFREVSAAVERGVTFPMLAGEYNLKLADVYDSDKEKQQIADYISIYESIGTKNGSSGGSMMMDDHADGSCAMALRSHGHAPEHHDAHDFHARADGQHGDDGHCGRRLWPLRT